MNEYTDASPGEIETAVQSSWQAFTRYRKMNLKDRADFLRTIAKGLQSRSEEIIKIAAGNIEKLVLDLVLAHHRSVIENVLDDNSTLRQRAADVDEEVVLVARLQPDHGLFEPPVEPIPSTPVDCASSSSRPGGVPLP